MLALLGVGTVVSLGVAIWVSNTGPVAASTKTSTGPAPAVAAAAATAARQVRTSTLHGSQAGYDAVVLLTQTDAGSKTVSTLDVRLSTQATPASAPTAEARLVGVDHSAHTVALTIIGAGHWSSGQFTLPAGRYALTVSFDRNGGPIRVPMTAVLT
ncbi:MAG: hypothetical protein M3Y44_16285 [Actinomycetota bacterium]|nr:hypothetical protein [Actinomycetota bacterium]